MQRCSLLVAFVLFVGFTVPVGAENWQDYRGPTGQGHYAGKGLPIEWSTTKNVVWKQAIPGHGWSSPIIQDGKVYLTTAVPAKGTKDQSLQAICLDAGTGKQVWQTEVFKQDGKSAPGIHGKNSHASPSPVTDGKRLFVFFGHQGAACLDLKGKVIWRNRDLTYAPVHGNGGSPILVDDKLIFSCDGGDKQFVAALNADTGKLAWKTNRGNNAARTFSFSTPLLITVNGKQQLISPGSDAVMAYDPADGKEIWRVTYDGYSVIPRPVYGHGMIYISTGYNTPSVLAIRVGGTGDVTKTHVAWTAPKSAPHTPSPLLVGTELYLVSDRGIASCLDAITGKAHWQERVGGNAFSASPFFADGKVYLQAEDGTTTVVRATTQFEKLATNELKERTFACYAAADGALYLRGEKHLFRIEAK